MKLPDHTLRYGYYLAWAGVLELLHLLTLHSITPVSLLSPVGVFIALVGVSKAVKVRQEWDGSHFTSIAKQQLDQFFHEFFILRMDGTQREQAILDQFLAGNIPDFLRRLRPIFLSHQFENGKSFTAALSAMPDYLAIGFDRDFLRIPLNLYTAMEIAKRYGFFLPTRKIDDAIFSQSAFRLSPQPMPPGPRMRSTAYYLEHNQRIRKLRLALGFPLGELVAGHKKDVVMTSRLVPEKVKIAIYGWHRPWDHGSVRRERLRH